MSGVTVIAEHLCRVIELGELIGTGIFITILCIGGIALCWFCYKHFNLNKKDKNTFIACLILLIILITIFWPCQINKYNTTHMEYTVTVDDSVSFIDFYEKYEIISANGNEFRVKEK